MKNKERYKVITTLYSVQFPAPQVPFFYNTTITLQYSLSAGWLEFSQPKITYSLFFLCFCSSLHAPNGPGSVVPAKASLRPQPMPLRLVDSGPAGNERGRIPSGLFVPRNTYAQQSSQYSVAGSDQQEQNYLYFPLLENKTVTVALSRPVCVLDCVQPTVNGRDEISKAYRAQIQRDQITLFVYSQYNKIIIY